MNIFSVIYILLTTLYLINLAKYNYNTIVFAFASFILLYHLYSDLNTGRLPSYHRLDISLKKKFSFSKFNELEISTGLTNVYNRKNIFYYNRVDAIRVNQLPIIPSLGVSWKF